MTDALKHRVSVGAILGGIVTILGMFGWILQTGMAIESRLTRLETSVSCHMNPANCGNSQASK